MDLGGLLLVAAVALVLGVYLAQPLRRHTGREVSAEEREYSTLMAERERILRALEELEFDFTLGKLDEADYRAQRAELLRQGAEVLRRLDALTQAQPTASAEERLAAEVAKRRADAAVEPSRPRRPVLEDDDIETLLARRRRQRQARAAGFCPRCGGPLFVGDRFCPRCGHAVQSS